MYKKYKIRAAPQVGNEYCLSKNVKGLSPKALEVIGMGLQKFDENDLDGNGTLDPQEILQKLRRDDYYGFATDSDVEKFLNEFDKDGNGKIDREEWIRKTVLSWANKTYIPQFISVAAKGKVGRDALVAVMTDDGYDGGEVTDFIDRSSLDTGEGIDFKKFIHTFFDVDGRH